MDRRHFNALLASMGGYAAASSILGLSHSLSEIPTRVWAAEPPNVPRLVRYPQKTDLILLTDRPPQLETPLEYFETDLTPNEAFFVRWHLSGIPTSVDTRTFRLEVSGNGKKTPS